MNARRSPSIDFENHRPRPIVWLLLGSFFACLLTHPAFAGDRPNFLLVISDDQGYWDTGVSGNRLIDTPSMDRLAAEGVTLNRFYAAPVCAPTRASLMTGRHSLRTGLYNTRFGGDNLGLGEVTLAQILNKSGYRTGLFGKWHLGQYPGYQPMQRGFDEFFGHYHGHIERYSFPDQLVHNGRPVAARGYVTDLFTDAAVDFIAADSEEPFFCMVAFNAPHSPFQLDTSHLDQPRGDKLIEKYLARALPLREARIYSMVERIDQNLERLLQTLEKRGLRERTLVCYMSDNGGVSAGFNAGLRGHKAGVYEGGVRVPFFASWPGTIPQGVNLNSQATCMDLLPTFCELAGVELPTDRMIDGRSLAPLLMRGQEAKLHSYVYHTWNRFHPNADNRWAVSDGTWKLLAQTGDNTESSPEKWALYNLHDDPGEVRNLRMKHPELVAALRSEFHRWFVDVTKGQTYQPPAIPLGHPEEREIDLQPSWAKIEGEGLEYIFDGYDWDIIQGWSGRGEGATWQMEVLRPDEYEVVVSYGCPLRSVGSRFVITVGEELLEFAPQGTPSGNVFRVHNIGTVSVSRGMTSVRVSTVIAKDADSLRLNAIRLRRLERPGQKPDESTRSARGKR